MDRYQQPHVNDHAFDSSTENERRRHPRYTMNKKVLLINEDILAEVVDISESGISLQCLANVAEKLNKIITIEIVDCGMGTSVEDLFCRLVRSSKKVFSPASFSAMIMNFSLEFLDLSQIKRKQLLQFIEDGRGSCIERKKHMEDTSKSSRFYA
jgi:c-di-GMP-binding flagellar brake protein YcgR